MHYFGPAQATFRADISALAQATLRAHLRWSLASFDMARVILRFTPALVSLPNLDRFGTKKQRHTGQRHMYLAKAPYMMAYVP